MTYRTTLAAAAVILLCVLALGVDYARARYREPRDEARVTAIEEQVHSNASLAPGLEAEKKRITDAKRARKTRIRALSWVLMAAAALFLTGAKRLVRGGPRRAALPGSTRASARRAGQKPGGRLESPLHTRQEPDIPATVGAIVAREGRGPESAIAILQAIQAHFRYLPDEAIRHVCAITDITPAQIAGTSSFYSRFRSTPVGDHVIRVCHGTACHVSGARQVTDELRRGLGIPEGTDTDPDRRFTIEEVACLGCCSLAPVLMVDDRTAGKLTPATACDAVAQALPAEPRA